MNDRDHFAAAALTGLLATGQGPYHPLNYFAKSAYEAADAMLRERERTNHDAAPAARACVGRPRTDKADLPTRAGTGDTPVAESATTAEPVAWAVVCGDCVDSAFTDRDKAVEWACGLIPPPQIVPLYRSPALTDAEREAVAYYVGTGGPDRVDAILRGLLERLGGNDA